MNWAPFAKKVKYNSYEHYARTWAKRHLERRLHIPLDKGNWSRALEIVNAKHYAYGRESKHFETVLKQFIKQQLTGTAPIDHFREVLLSERVTPSVSGWKVVIWAYAQRRKLDDALWAAVEMNNRMRSDAEFTPEVRSEIGRILLPLCAEFGKGREASMVVDAFLAKSERTSQDIAHWLRSALAREGLWVEALRVSSSSSSSLDSTGKRLSSLTPLRSEATDCKVLLAELPPDAIDSFGVSSSTSRAAWTIALTCYFSLVSRWAKGTVVSSVVGHDKTAASQQQQHTQNDPGVRERAWTLTAETLQHPSLELTRRVLDVCGQRSLWETSLAVFETRFEQQRQKKALADAAPSTTLLSNSMYGPIETIDPVCCDLLFASFPTSQGTDERRAPQHPSDMESNSHTMMRRLQEARIPVSANPQKIVDLWNYLTWEELADGPALEEALNNCFVPKSVTSAVVGGALLQLGQWERALHIADVTLRTAFDPRTGKRRHRADSSVQEADRWLGRVVYAASFASDEARDFAFHKMWFLFPDEAKRIRLHRAPQESSPTPLQSPDVRVKPSSNHITLTAMYAKHTEDQLRNIREEQNARKISPEGYVGDPDREPREEPTGRFDRHTGWNYYHKSGTPRPEGRYRNPSILSSWPKQFLPAWKKDRNMWSLRDNSSYAHREATRKWNMNTGI